jgi:hypothetical protein
MFAVEGVDIYVVTGRKTQTVNICTDANTRGTYQNVFRLEPPLEALEAQLCGQQYQQIQELVHYLNSIGAASEGERASDGTSFASRTAPRRIPLEENDTEWARTAIQLLEQTIDELVLDFMIHPYMHRVEHSLHAEFFHSLVSHRALSRTLQGNGFRTQPVHKEWPEWATRPDKDNRRGNFDISVLSPETLKDAGISDFRHGHIEPMAAVELGLDYKLDHLTSDQSKLQNSKIRHPYLIHLVREDVSDNFEAVESFVLEHTDITAYARIYHGLKRWKLLGDRMISEV